MVSQFESISGPAFCSWSGLKSKLVCSENCFQRDVRHLMFQSYIFLLPYFYKYLLRELKRWLILNSLNTGYFFMILSILDILQCYFFSSKYFFRNKMSNSLDLNRAWCSVGPDLGSKCLQRSPADNKKWPAGRVKLWLTNMCLDVDISLWNNAWVLKA